MNEFARYCLVMHRHMRECHWSAMCKYRHTKDAMWLRIAKKYRIEAHDYADGARRNGYGKRIAA